jgi:hypothetical protein
MTGSRLNKLNNILSVAAAVFLLTTMLVLPKIASAQEKKPADANKPAATAPAQSKLELAKLPDWADCDTKDEVWGIPTWYKYLPGKKAPGVAACTPLGGQSFGEKDKNGKSGLDYIPAIGLAVIEILLRVVGIVSVVFVMYGGFQYLISQGEPDRIQSAKNTVLNAIIGLIIAMIATVLVNFIGKSLK